MITKRRRSGGLRWLEASSAAAAIIISALSLWVAIAAQGANQKMVEANTRMVAATSWPFIQLSSSNADENNQAAIILRLENAGVGPAKLESLEVFWRGRPFATSRELLADCCARAQRGPWSVITAPSRGKVLRAGESLRFLRLDRSASNEAVWSALERVRLRELSFRVCYCSVFEECWLSRLDGLRPPRVARCPNPLVPYAS